jgi:membrane-associated protease RseP (regulator of RpoE activity)
LQRPNEFSFLSSVMDLAMQDALRMVVPMTALMLACLAEKAACAEDAARPPAAFEPGDISIGEPIALPFAAPASPRGIQSSSPATVPMTAVAPATAPTSGPSSPSDLPAGAAANGWLGMAVAESNVPGRWSIVEVVPAGPAAAAGIRSGDELRAINGVPVRSADEVSQALTAIAAGQHFGLSVARADQVSEIALVAVPRPPVVAVRERQAGQVDAVPMQPVAPLAASPGASIPSVVATPDPTTVPAALPNAAASPPARSATASVLVPPPTATSTPSTTPGRPALPADVAGPAASLSAPVAALGAAPPVREPAARGRTALGVRTVPIDPGIQTRFRLPQAAGAYVIGVVGDLPASKAGIPPGSVIVSLGDRPVRSPQELTQLVSAGPIDRPVPLHYVLPGGTERRAEVVLQSLELPLEQALTGDESMQPIAAPAFQPGPSPAVGSAGSGRIAQRPAPTADAEVQDLRRETFRLRSLLEVLERRLDRLTR